MNARKGIIAVFGVFVAPVLVAALVFKMGWFNSGVTNKGEFMTHEVTLGWLLPEDPKEAKWTIFYRIPQNCDDTCNNVLYSLNQGYQALGKLQPKATPVAVRGDTASITPETLKDQYGFVNVRDELANQVSTLNQLSSDFVYLIDPFGKVILRYGAKAQKQEMIMITKDWMADLKRLLKYARTK